MLTANPYLNFDGQAEEAFASYRSILGGDFLGPLRKVSSAPGMEKLPEKEKNRVLHIALKVNDKLTIMASDIIPSFGHELKVGNNNYILLNVDSKADADRIFGSLSQDGEIEMKMGDQFWGAYFGSFIDKFGIHWMINHSSLTEG